MSKSYTVYRIRGAYYTTYTPVIRKRKPVTFKLKADAEQWLIDNPCKSTAEILPTYEVRRTIKQNIIDEG